MDKENISLNHSVVLNERKYKYNRCEKNRKF